MINNDFFNLFEKNSLIKNNKINVSKIETIPINKIIDIAKTSLNENLANDIDREKTIFTHSASISLGGGPWPCRGLSCRLDKIKELAQFSALYSDRVYINNFLSDFSSISHRTFSDDYEIRQRFYDDLYIFLYLRPLIDNHNIIPISPPNYCPHCIAKESFGRDADKRFDNAFTELTKLFNKEINVTCKFQDGNLEFLIEGPESIIEHNKLIKTYEGKPSYFNKNPRIMSRLLNGEEIVLSSNEKKGFEIDKELVGELRESILFELALSICIGTSFLTERPLDIDILQSISTNSEIERRNQVLQKHLTCFVPFLDGIEPINLLTLRNNEEEFILFRKAISKIIDENIKKNTGFSEKDAKNIYGDIIAPQLSKLDQKVKNAKKKLVKNTSTEICSWVGAISLGLYSGILPQDLIKVATALGLTKIVYELTHNVISKLDFESEINSEDFYYLWKVKQISEQNKLLDVI